MANFWIWSSFAALSVSLLEKNTFFDRLIGAMRHGSSHPSAALEADSPSVRTENGWTLIQCDDVDSFERWLGEDEGLPLKVDEEPSLGSHLLIELYDCEEASLKKEEFVASAMREAALKSEATVVAQSFHEFKPYGVSGAVIIQESHYTIHTWPEHSYAAVDLFYCGGTVKVHEAVEALRQRFAPKRIKFLVVRRGLKSEVDR